MKLISNMICRLYSMTAHYKLMKATDLRLAVVELPVPTADAQTILRLDIVLLNKLIGIVNRDLADVMKKIIETKVEFVPDFEFKKIQSLTASKSFGSEDKRVNGSWFSDISAWGKGMYPGDNLKDEKITDFRDNIRHIETEGFLDSETLQVSHYAWLDRYVCQNTGGSHHAAKIVYQSLRDGLSYKREAYVMHVKINKKNVHLLEGKYYAYIFKRKNDDNEGFQAKHKEAFEEAINSYLKMKAEIIDVHNYYPNIKMIFIPIKAVEDIKHSFDMWAESGVKSGRLIPLSEYLKSPNKYHTIPYSHGIKDIMLRNHNDYYV